MEINIQYADGNLESAKSFWFFMTDPEDMVGAHRLLLSFGADGQQQGLNADAELKVVTSTNPVRVIRYEPIRLSANTVVTPEVDFPDNDDVFRVRWLDPKNPQHVASGRVAFADVEVTKAALAAQAQQAAAQTQANAEWAARWKQGAAVSEAKFAADLAEAKAACEVGGQMVFRNAAYLFHPTTSPTRKQTRVVFSTPIAKDEVVAVTPGLLRDQFCLVAHIDPQSHVTTCGDMVVRDLAPLAKR